MKIGIVINARLASKRLPKKHLRDIAGKTAIEQLLDRLMPCADVPFFLATGDPKENAPFKDLLKTRNVEIFFGDPVNIPNRHLQIAKKYNLGAMVSIDADDVLTSPKALQDTLVALRDGKELVRTEGLPLGMNVLWCYTVPLLKRAVQKADTKNSMDTGWGHIFWDEQVHRIVYDIKDADKIRMTLDYPEDMRFFRAVYDEAPLAVFNDDEKLCGWIIANRVHKICKKWV